MLINNAWGNEGGSGGEGNIIIQGSTNSIKDTVNEMNQIETPKNGDICHVTSTKELYIYKDGIWTIIPTGDIFYNKLASTIESGHVQLTNDITSTSEELAVTPKALSQAIEEVKSLIDDNNEGWGDFNDGIENGEGEDNFTWENWQ